MTFKPKHICFIVAMQGEAQPLIDHYGLRPQVKVFPHYLPMRLFQNDYRNHRISLVTNGHDERFDIDNIGTQAATLSTFVAIEHLEPDLIINVGTAGGFREKGLDIGDVVLAQGAVYFHDRRIPIDKFREYGLGSYPLSDQTELIRRLGIKAGILSTGNAFDYSKNDQQVMDQIGATVKDMEAAAIAWVCEMSKVPLIILKGVTDFVDTKVASEAQFIQNFTRCMENVKSKSIQLIDHLTGS
jgi:5'-methylthioadenosine nucleosidase